MDPRISVAILDDDLPGFDRAFVKRLAAELTEAGCDVATLSASQVCDAKILSPDKYFLYVIPQCRTYPAAGLDPLMAYASRRGHVLFLGGPFLDDPVWPANRDWFNRAAIRAAKDGAAPQNATFGPEPLSAAGWQRTCDDALHGRGLGKSCRRGPEDNRAFGSGRRTSRTGTATCPPTSRSSSVRNRPC